MIDALNSSTQSLTTPSFSIKIIVVNLHCIVPSYFNFGFVWSNLGIQVRFFVSSELLDSFLLRVALIIPRHVLPHVQFLHILIYFLLVKLFSAITNNSSVLVRSNENYVPPASCKHY